MYENVVVVSWRDDLLECRGFIQSISPHEPASRNDTGQFGRVKDNGNTLAVDNILLNKAM